MNVQTGCQLYSLDLASVLWQNRHPMELKRGDTVILPKGSQYLVDGSFATITYDQRVRLTGVIAEKWQCIGRMRTVRAGQRMRRRFRRAAVSPYILAEIKERYGTDNLNDLRHHPDTETDEKGRVYILVHPPLIYWRNPTNKVCRAYLP
jgi:hypothetical protein